MLKTEVAELFEQSSKIYDVAEKTHYGINLNTEEKEAASVMDAWAKDVGKRGKDPDCEIAAFVERTVTEEIYNAPDELLDEIFERGSTGEFDDTQYNKTPKNTLKVYESSKGGNVDRSYLDFGILTPVSRNLQVETDLSYVDLRKNGWKAVSTLTTYAKEALQNAQFGVIFGILDAAITGGDQVINAAVAMPTMAEMDEFALYLNEHASGVGAASMVGLMKYQSGIRRMAGWTEYLSNDMKNDFNRYGLLQMYDAIRFFGISSAHKLGNGQTQIPDKRIFGIADKIGFLDQKGEIHVYQDMDNNHERIHLMVKDFTFSMAINDISKVAKIVLP